MNIDQFILSKGKFKHLIIIKFNLLEVGTSYDIENLPKELNLDEISLSFEHAGAKVSIKNDQLKTEYTKAVKKEIKEYKNVNSVKRSGDIEILLYLKNLPKNKESFLEHKIVFLLRLICYQDIYEIFEGAYDDLPQKNQYNTKENHKLPIKIRSELIPKLGLKIIKTLSNKNSYRILFSFKYDDAYRFIDIQRKFKLNPNIVNKSLKTLQLMDLIKKDKNNYKKIAQNYIQELQGFCWEI